MVASTDSYRLRWESVEATMEIEKVRPDTKADTLKSYYHALVTGLRKHLPPGEFESLAGELKTKGSRPDSWTDNQKSFRTRLPYFSIS
jgi:hypothetical protein